MKLFAKLSTLISAVVRGPQQRQRRLSSKEEAPAGDAGPLASIGQDDDAADIARSDVIEQGRVADLLERRLASSEEGASRSEKGDRSWQK
jgi:hypothetical protein